VGGVGPAAGAVELPGAAAAVDVAAGARHSVVVDAGGAVFTFGWGLYGTGSHSSTSQLSLSHF